MNDEDEYCLVGDGKCDYQIHKEYICTKMKACCKNLVLIEIDDSDNGILTSNKEFV